MNELCAVVGPTTGRVDDRRSTVDVEYLVGTVLVPAVASSGRIPLVVPMADLTGPNASRATERLRLCGSVVADITAALPALWFELGRRSVTHSRESLILLADRSAAEFDSSPELRGLVIEYDVDAHGRLTARTEFAHELRDRLGGVRSGRRLGIEELMGAWPGLPHSKTDVFRDVADLDPNTSEVLAEARAGADPVRAVRRVETTLGDLTELPASTAVDVLLSYRAVSAWTEMIGFVERLPPVLGEQALVVEQYALALNRAGRAERAVEVIDRVIARDGPSTESLSILGRIRKDQYLAAAARGEVAEASCRRGEAIDAYLRGFELDWRDAYPGVNAVQLIHRTDPTDARLGRLLPVVEYAVQRKLARGPVDYWDHATLVELAVIADERCAAEQALVDALALAPEPWMADTTADTLRAILEGGGPSWVEDLEQQLRASPRW